MKKILSIATLLSLLLSCDNGNTEPDATTGASIPPEEQQENNTDPASDGKTLIVFFSRAGENWQVGVVERGNTAIMADYIKEYTGADVFEIVPEVAYPQGYDETLTVATNEKNNKARPKFKGKIDDIGQYGNVFIGGPVWWSEPPMIIHTFCEAYPELKDKTIIPFGTHGGSGIGSYTTKLKEHYPNAEYLEALGISGASIRDAESKTKVENWLKKIGFEKETANDMTIDITASGKTFNAEIEDSETGKAFLAKLPLTLDMSELNGNEKYCYGVDLPRADKQYDSIAAGDLMLYSGNCLVLFYGSAGGYSYTRIGKLTGTEGLAEALGDGSVKVTFSKQ